MALDPLSEPTVGLLIIPSLLDKDIQLALLDKLLHRDLSNPSHKTNLHMHYDMTYPQSPNRSTTSFFSNNAGSISHQPKDPSIHKPLPMSSCLTRKLRWVTIGGQYDWTQKVYPASAPPPFPEDVAALVEGLFPSMKAQAAIVNLYTPSDTLSLHRDVSEECDRPLVSISLGCDAIFMAGLEGSKGVAVRLRSGDALVMSGPARYAWHGVPQILPGTCPEWMADWPCREHASEAETYEHWKGWMARKRINLNVRQMWE
jgi:DNA alkylation damage repair protein AlkB